MSTTGIADGYYSLADNLNKAHTEDEGVVSQSLLPELELSMSDDELIQLKNKWQKNWEEEKKILESIGKRNERYWKGSQGQDVPNSDWNKQDKAIADNLIFKSLEEFLPAATKQNPEAVVTSDNTPEGAKISYSLSKMLGFQADRLQMKIQLKQVMRFWAIYRVGVAKMGWSNKTNDISMTVLPAKRLIMDKDATIVNGMYMGEYIGEYKEETAENLAHRFPNVKTALEEKTNGQWGTKVKYIEWWTDKYVFWTMEDDVLGKIKNPHWNYPEEKEQVDENGQTTVQDVPGHNHLPYAQKPYVFFSVFNLQKKPYDDTSLIEQVIPIQDMIKKRVEQIDRNADNTNGGIVINGNFFTKEQASMAVVALSEGGYLWVPPGPETSSISNVFQMTSGAPLAAFVYQNLVDMRKELSGVFGVQGLSAAGQSQDRTVRGKIITRQHDMDRIGGGVSEYLEQFADQIFNWFLQLMCVYYTDEHVASVLGKERAVEYITIKNTDLNRKFMVTIKEGSMLPKDTMAQRNEAIDLWSAGALDPITLFEKLDFPNPRESARQLFMWQTNPASLFPEIPQPIQQGLPTPAPQAPTGDAGSPPQPNASPLSQVPIKTSALPGQPKM